MNCKPGDLAVYVGHFPEFHGAIVTCISLYYWHGYPCWVIDPPIKHGRRGQREDACADISLKPLRDNDGEDETLQWAGKPEKVTV